VRQANSPGRAARELIEHGVDHAGLGAVSTKVCATSTYSETMTRAGVSLRGNL
jgi:hypothetical protein